MTNKNVAILILKNAEAITSLVKSMQTAAKNKVKEPQIWIDACKLFHNSYDLLAFPGGLEPSLKLLKQQDQATIEIAIEYLKIDPYCFRSGYIKQAILRLLKQAVLTQQQKERLQEIIIARINGKPQREFREYCRLARKIANTHFYAQLYTIINESSTDLRITRQAQLMLDALNA